MVTDTYGERYLLPACGDPGLSPRSAPPSPAGQASPRLTLSIMAKILSTRFSGVFSSSGSSTVFPCQTQTRSGLGSRLWALGQKRCPPDLGRFQMRVASLSLPSHPEQPPHPSPSCLPGWSYAE